MQIDEEEISCGDKASCKRKEGVRGCYCDRGYDGDPYVGCEGISKKNFHIRCNIFICTIFHHPKCANLNTWLIPVHSCVAQCMLNGVLHNPMAYTNEYSICVWHVCALENGDISECYTGTIVFLLIQCPSIYYHNQIIDISKTVCFSMLISIT